MLNVQSSTHFDGSCDHIELKRFVWEARALQILILFVSVCQGEVTFFKGVYRRHTNFAKEAVTMDFQQTAAWGQKTTCTISRTGDLLSKTWLRVDLPALNPEISPDDWDRRMKPLTGLDYKETRDPTTGLNDESINSGYYPGSRYCDEVGHAMIDKVDLIIGGTTIDSHPGHYLQVWNELTTTEEKKKLDKLIGKSGNPEELQIMAMRKQELCIPLQFFFCRHLMQCLPLIALQ